MRASSQPPSKPNSEPDEAAGAGPRLDVWPPPPPAFEVWAVTGAAGAAGGALASKFHSSGTAVLLALGLAFVRVAAFGFTTRLTGLAVVGTGAATVTTGAGCGVRTGARLAGVARCLRLGGEGAGFG